MISIICGIILSALAQVYINAPYLSLFIFLIFAALFQFLYARKLNNYLGGEDPVPTYRARDFGELRTKIPIPTYIVIMEKLPKIAGIAALITLLIALGILS